MTQSGEQFSLPCVNPRGKFRIQNKQLFLTYKSHIDYEYFEKTMLESLSTSGNSVGKWIICHEKADSSDPYLHTHVVIEFNKAVDTQNCRFFDLTPQEGGYKLGVPIGEEPEEDTIHPNIQKVKKWVAAVKYCQKEGDFRTNLQVPKTGGSDDMKTIVSSIASCKSKREAFEMASTIRDVISINTIYDTVHSACPNDEFYERIKNEFVPRQWQSDLIDIIEQTTDRRSVIWAYDLAGGKGKTMLSDYLEACDPETTLCMSATGMNASMNDVVRNWMESGHVPGLVLIDLPRNCSERGSIYEFIENLKNGRLTCLKYKGSQLRFQPCKVVVFANWPPKVDMMSSDRWRIYRIKGRTDPKLFKKSVGYVNRLNLLSHTASQSEDEDGEVKDSIYKLEEYDSVPNAPSVVPKVKKFLGSDHLQLSDTYF